MIRCFMSIAALLLAAPAGAADLSAMCQGWTGNWHVEDDSSKSNDGSWKPDLSDPLWQVKSVGAGKCHFVMSEKGDDDFDVDTTQGFYEVTNWKDGKPLPVERYTVVSSAIEDARSWTVVVAAPHKSRTSRYARLAMTMAGDLFSIMIETAASPDAPYYPRALTLHRRVQP